MKTFHIFLPLLVLGLVLSSGSIVACGDDGGEGGAGSGGINPGGSGGNPGGSCGSEGGSGGGGAGGSGGSGPCVNTETTCDECIEVEEITDPSTDYYHVCADSTASCIPFANTRVPGWPNAIPTP